MKTHVINFSGGRTSARLICEIERLRKSGEWTAPVEYLFADTQAEDPKTYEFIRNFVKHTGISLTCIRAEISSELGVGTTYRIINIDEIGCTLDVWRDMLAAYSSPFNPGGGFCTDMLKSIPSDKYCDEKYGKGNYFKWIGYRADEAKRAWGHEIYSSLLKIGLNQDDSLDLMISCMSSNDVNQIAFDTVCDTIDAFNPEKTSKLADKIIAKVGKIKKAGFRFMFELLDDEKEDVKDFWREMPFDLEIEEHLGNCVFCIKKGDNRIELAARDRPALADEWKKLFESETVRDLGRSFPPNVIYRGHLSFDAVRLKYQGVDSDYIKSQMKGAKVSGTSSGCSDSCSAFSNQLDMF